MKTIRLPRWPISVGQHSLTVGHDSQVTGGLAAREIIMAELMAIAVQ
jgi:hypothetical protein